MYTYGFLPHNFGHRWLIISKRKRKVDDTSLGDYLDVDDESDYEESDVGTEPEEEFLPQDRRPAWAELEDHHSPPNKRARHDVTIVLSESELDKLL